MGLIHSVSQTSGGRPSSENMDEDDGVMLGVGVMDSGCGRCCRGGRELVEFAGGRALLKNEKVEEREVNLDSIEENQVGGW
jgi:hypothetical protein